MKRFVITAVLIVGFELTGSCQYATFSRQNNSTNEITIPTGEVWQVVNWSGYGSGAHYFTLRTGGDASIRFYGTDNSLRSMENPLSPVGLLIQGPAILNAGTDLRWPEYSYFLVIKKLQGTSLSNSISATSVVIPSASTGDVDIKLEQSADNVTWTECLPGTYNSSTVKRFFRLRAVEK